MLATQEHGDESFHAYLPFYRLLEFRKLLFSNGLRGVLIAEP